MNRRSGLRNNAGPDGDSLSLDLATDASGQNHSGLEIGNAYRTNPLTVLVDDDTIIINEHNELESIGGGMVQLYDEGPGIKLGDSTSPEYFSTGAAYSDPSGHMDIGGYQYLAQFSTITGLSGFSVPAGVDIIAGTNAVVLYPDNYEDDPTNQVILYRTKKGGSAFHHLATITAAEAGAGYPDLLNDSSLGPRLSSLVEKISVRPGPAISVTGGADGKSVTVIVGTNMNLTGGSVNLDEDITIHSATVTSMLDVLGSATIHATLHAYINVMVDGALTVGGVATLHVTHVLGAATIDGTMTVVGHAEFDGGASFDGGSVTLDGTNLWLENSTTTVTGGIFEVDSGASFDVQCDALFEHDVTVSGDIGSTTVHAGTITAALLHTGAIHFDGAVGTPSASDIHPWYYLVIEHGGVTGYIPVYGT